MAVVDIVRLASEAEELVDALGQRLLAIESEGLSRDAIDECFRGVHTLKGLAMSAGNVPVAQVAHRLEALFEGLPGDGAVAPELLDLMHEANELFARDLGGADDGATPLEVIEDLGARLEAAAAGARASEREQPDVLSRVDPELLEVLTRRERRHLQDSLAAGKAVVRLVLSWPPAALRDGVTRLKEGLAPPSELISLVPGSDRGDDIGLDAVVAGGGDAEALGATATRAGARFVAVVPVATPPETAAPAARSPAQTIRVDVRKVDGLLGAVGDLSVVAASISAAEGALRRAGDAAAADRLRGDLARLEARIGELQKGLIGVRMIPLGPVLGRLGRVARRMARNSGKRIHLELSGTSTEVDKMIAEELTEPLLHIIRNAIDHAIEAPERREAAGKPAEGTIAIEARQEGSQLVLDISDDGRGVDRQHVLEVAKRRGTGRTSTLDDHEILDLLFRPGFSTRETADLTSGRGVGLDAVRAAVARLGGVVGMESDPGRGARVSIRVPITLAMAHGLLVRVGEQRFALPVSGVVESVEVQRDELISGGSRRRVEYRGHRLSVARIADLLDLGLPEPATQTLVVSGVGSSRIGLLVDELLGAQDMVVKPMPRALSTIPGISGASELGGAHLVLVLDTPAILAEARRLAGASSE